MSNWKRWLSNRSAKVALTLRGKRLLLFSRNAGFEAQFIKAGQDLQGGEETRTDFRSHSGNGAVYTAIDRTEMNRALHLLAPEASAMVLPEECIRPVREFTSDGESTCFLGNERFSVEIATPIVPGIHQLNPRFDTTAAVRSIRVDGEEFLTGEGLVDEFDIRWNSPPGYGDAVPGGVFLKIGVGDLIRSDEREYDFYHEYPVSRLADTFKHGGGRKFVVAQSFRSITGWAYHYEKTYRVDPSSSCLSIEYRLTNDGDREILSEQYNHNYFRRLASGGWRPCTLEFDFGISEVETDWFQRSGRTMTIPASPSQPRYFMTLLPVRPHVPELELRIPDLQRRIVLGGDFSASRFALYADNTALCPEIFTSIRLAASASHSWVRTYRFPPA